MPGIQQFTYVHIYICIHTPQKTHMFLKLADIDALNFCTSAKLIQVLTSGLKKKQMQHSKVI